MKTETKYVRRLIVGTVMTILGLFSCFKANAQEIFAELTDMKQVESTYISGRWAPTMPTWRNMTGTHAIDLREGFSALYTYNCYSIESVAKAHKILDSYLKKNSDIEVVMRTREGSSAYEIYERFTPDNRLTQMIIWSSDAPNVAEIVVVDWKEGLQR